MEPPTVHICPTPHFDRLPQKVGGQCEMGGGAKIYNCSDKVTAGVIHHRLWPTEGV